ncbi:SDR family oxidoreductase [Klebsiella pneumoniae]|nr:SDR family NAD(P)-dependent oxidoreductase [Klebsiella pneumoniae]MCJ4592428.1 SDR family NAD(P)-dependent oxidoreductase [Klebsiella pneumoniae]
MSVMVITGGTAGAGKATALRFARAGYHVALIARDETGLQETRQACERFGIKTLAISADVVDAGALQRAAAEVETTLGAIDVWINNAMTTVLAPFRQMSEEEFRRVTEVTYLGYVNGTRAALEVMIPRDRGVIIQAGSALAWRSIPLQSAYCGAKAAIRGFTDAVRTELMHEKSHIQLTMVQLPGMNTAQFGWARNKMDQAMQPVPRSISRKSPPRLFTASSSARSTSCGSEKAPSSRSSARSSSLACSIG